MSDKIEKGRKPELPEASGFPGDYMRACLREVQEKLGGYASIAEIEGDLDRINAYPGVADLEDPRDVLVVEEAGLTPADIERAKADLLDGRLFMEHAAAGEGTRLRLGPKFLIDPVRDLTLESVAETITETTGEAVDPAEVHRRMTCLPQDLLPLSLGVRHLAQMSYEVARLARETGRDPRETIARQRMLLVLHEESGPEIVEEVRRHRFFGLDPANVYFIFQRPFPGIDFRDGEFFFAEGSPERLHNHGQMAMQQAEEGQIFHLHPGGADHEERLSTEDFSLVLAAMSDKISFNIEDLDYLAGALDLESAALALRLGDEGCRMTMEVVANNPENPQKGGMAAYDPRLEYNVMVESFQLLGVANEDIVFLNKNFNHYPQPAAAWRAVKKDGLPLHVTVKDGYLYFQPVQGDINFLVATRFTRRRVMKPIFNWKTPLQTPPAVRVMHEQDRQPGFRELVTEVMGVDC